MEGFLYLIFGYSGGGGFPYISRIHTAYIGEDSSILGYLKFLVKFKGFPSKFRCRNINMF